MRLALTLVLTMTAAVAIAAPASPPIGAVPGGTPALIGHRAVYELKLVRTRGKAGIQAVRGRILYDLTGSACEGYALSFRQVSQLDVGEGRNMVSDLRATTWEEGAGKLLRFHSENRLEDKLRDTTDGQAERAEKGISVKITQPAEKTLDMPGDLVFPTEHVRRVLAAARDGKTVLEVGVYDGSEKGEKIYDTMAVIGRRIEPGEKPTEDAAGKDATLAKLARWPVTISYFDRGKSGGEQTPIYAISFEIYENGVSRALMLDYNDFVLSGEIASLDLKEGRACP